ncbi:MAG: FmdB family zinc ribbon protein [Fibrobacterota bacterium]
MPTYEYECRKCGKTLEKFQKMTARPIKKCPDCGENTLERIISGGAGFLFKGDGFYETDYRSSEYKEKAKKEAESSKPSGKKDNSKKSIGKKEKAAAD